MEHVFKHENAVFNGMQEEEYMDLVATKPVFGVSDKAGLKPVSSATETS